MSKIPDVSLLKRIGEVEGDDPDDTVLLGKLWAEAHRYIASFRWCPRISDAYLAFGVGGVIGVFLVRFAEKIGGTDDWLWVVSGDLPSAYFVLDDATDAETALTVYCELMENWVEAVMAGRPLEGIFPVSAASTVENARLLRARVDYLRSELIPECRERTRLSLEGKNGAGIQDETL
jgi:hypothetical protein